MIFLLTSQRDGVLLQKVSRSLQGTGQEIYTESSKDHLVRRLEKGVDIRCLIIDAREGVYLDLLLMLNSLETPFPTIVIGGLEAHEVRSFQGVQFLRPGFKPWQLSRKVKAATAAA